MTAPFLVRFVDQLVARLLAEGELELVEGQQEAVIRMVAGQLGTLGQGSQLISSLSRALIAHPGVVELYLDDEELMHRVSELGGDWIRG